MRELVVNDEYIKEVGEYFAEQGKEFQKWTAEYLAIMKNVQQNVIAEGAVAESLKEFIASAERINGDAELLLTSVKDYLADYLAQIDEKDRFLF